ncbi:MAG: glucosamine-6-phosphate deaminase [Chloroflexota bacterium]
MKGPQVLVEADHAAVGRRAARLVDDAIRTTPGIVLALPTGSTPVPMYAELVRLRRVGGNDWSRVTTFNLDEYVGVAPEHPESYARYMAEHLSDGVDAPADRRHLPDGLASDPAAECERYEREIELSGGIDVAVLGVGLNGHLGFNEPGTALTARTHVAELAPETWRRNFPQLAEELAHRDHTEAPFRRAYTMGIGTILQARRVVLLASGEAKRQIVKAALTGPVTTQNPSSLLRLHREVTVILDRAASFD